MKKQKEGQRIGEERIGEETEKLGTTLGQNKQNCRVQKIGGGIAEDGFSIEFPPNLFQFHKRLIN
jgi:hypothetical protein